MNRTYHRWHSPHLQRDMELLVFGHGGARVLAFPTSRRRFWEWEDFGLVGALREHLERAWIQLFCIDGIDEETWYAQDRTLIERARRHIQYDRYVAEEVVPFTREVNSNPFAIAAGASFGGYHAVNFSLRHPEVVNRVIGMSGLYDIHEFTGGAQDPEVYGNNPCDYVGNEHDPDRLLALRRLDIILAVGRDDPACESNRRLSGLLSGKEIFHALRIWDGFAHDWPYWVRMMHLYLAGHD
jgi:esterase/lipase superfamily enzyme